MDEYAQQVDTVREIFIITYVLHNICFQIPYGMAQTEEYPHACSYCDKSFSNMALLLKHEQVKINISMTLLSN